MVFFVVYGMYNRYEVDLNYGVGVGKEVLLLMSMVIVLENGYEFGSLMIDYVI